ncbi:MAG: AAA family ATPase, partial [Fuerstiella sp.]|nr:AAA family ATPase [Fuerstiella sp.]
GCTLADVVDELTAKLSELDSTTTRRFAGAAVSDLWSLADQPIEWLVDGVFSAGQPTIFGAKQKALKTTLLSDLAVCLATGWPWLRKFEVPKKRRVLMIVGEASEGAAIRKIRRAAASLNLRAEDFNDQLRIEAVNFPTLPSTADCAAVQRVIKEHTIEVVILDPLYMGLQGVNTTNLTEVGPAMRQFMQSCYPASVVIAHHIKKSASFDDAPNLEDLSQAGIAEFAGNYWLMGRMGEYQGDGKHTLAVRYGGRDEQFGLLKLDFDEQKWTADITSLLDHRSLKSQQRENERIGKVMQDIKSYLTRNGGQASCAALAEAAGTKPRRESFQSVIDELCSHGGFKRVTMKTANNRTCEGLKIFNGQNSPDSVL